MADEKKINGDSEAGGGGKGIVKVDPKPSKGLSSKVIDLLEKLVVKLMYDSSKPHHWLSGNLAPVLDETPPTKDLTVKGHLPVSRSCMENHVIFIAVCFLSLKYYRIACQ